MPERFAQQALGHGSKAVARAYAKRAVVKVPSLEDTAQACRPFGGFDGKRRRDDAKNAKQLSKKVEPDSTS
jgi:hypothetical protein